MTASTHPDIIAKSFHYSRYLRDVVLGQGSAIVPVVIGGSPEAPRFAPFEQIAVPAELSGGEGA